MANPWLLLARPSGCRVGAVVMRPEGMTEGHEPIFYINGVEPHAHTHLLMVPWMMDPSWAILAARGRPARMFSAERSALLL